MPIPTKYTAQRRRVVPPHVDIHSLRTVAGITIDELRTRMEAATGKPAPSRGAISAIELGYRGASADILTALALAYGLPPGAVTTTYLPRATSLGGKA